MTATHIRFDWAMKRLLRNKSDFDILAGFLSELLREDITIKQILESESNADTELDKTNKVDLLVENDKGERILIEIQNNFESDYFYRILFGVSKVITENLNKGDPYRNIKKVIAVHIVYFDLGQGEDYVYKGLTEFTGIHQNDTLQLSESQKQSFGKEKVSDIYPEIYLLKVNNFDNETKDTLDEWIYFFKNSVIKDEFNAKGIQKAKAEWNIMCLTDEERKVYNRYVSQLQYERSVIGGRFEDGKLEGRKEGRQEGMEIGLEIGAERGRKVGETNKALEIAKKMKAKGLDTADIMDITGLSAVEIEGV